MTSYRTFWVVCGLYFLILGFGAASGMEFLKWVASFADGFGQQINIDRIPLYHFPDVWLNLIWSGGFLKIFLGIMVVISITNEYTYRTLRQNVIDGMSRAEFLCSKMLTNVLLSMMSVMMIFVVGLITGMIYSPSLELHKMITDTEFFFAYFLEIFAFLSYALMLGILIQRSGLTIILLLLSNVIEFIITSNVDDHLPGIIPYFPMRSIFNLVTFPFPRYALQEIQDYLDVLTVAIALGWTAIFNFISYRKLQKADI